ncbi:MAG: metalloregulator ArsR/SmtB family transcription factor [Alphaproteobacteria bacterium]|nr:metalloregulator ArsR/SmtB family transcription factor [Alphaproteobacteria bacterium]
MNKQQIEAASKILKAIANENRLKVLYLISEREMSVGEIEALLNLSQSALSQHLAVLRSEHIVKTRRVAQTIFYGIKNEKVRELLHMLSVLF